MKPGTSPAATGSTLLGRREELSELRAGLEDARVGHGRLFLVAGEAGIGKSRLVQALIEEADPTEVRTRSGRCVEGAAAPPFLPWVQALRACVSETPSGALAQQLGAGAPYLAHLVPELEKQLSGLVPAAPSDWPDARLRLFDSVVGFLRNLAADEPLLLTLEDLHAADEGSLRLLLHLVQDLAPLKMLVVGSYRDAEARSSPQLHRRLAAIARYGRRIVLSGLDEGDASMLLEETAGREVDRSIARHVYYLSDGNPSFVAEVGRLWRVESPDESLPEEVHAVVRRRMDSLPARVHELLEVSAVIGYQFELALLEGATNLGIEEIHTALRTATAMNFIEEVGPDRWVFGQAVVRDALYDGIRLSRRVELHGQVAEALESVLGDGVRDRLTELAHHCFEGARAGDSAKARQYCILAGHAAMSCLGYEDAISHYSRALETLELIPGADHRIRYDLFTAIGQAALRLGDLDRVKDMQRQALKSARALGSPDLLAAAAVGFGHPESLVDQSLTSALQEASAALPPGDSGLRARVLLATAAASPRPEAASALSRDSLDMARRVGDAQTLGVTLWGWHDLNLDPELLQQRLSVTDELVGLAAASGDREGLLHARLWHAHHLFTAGEVRDAAEELEWATIEADTVGLPWFVWRARRQQASVALLQGRLKDAERYARQAVAAGERSDVATEEELISAQLFAIRREQGRFEERVDIARRAIERFPHSAPALLRGELVLTLAEAGQPEVARRELEGIADNLLETRGADRAVGPVLVAEISWSIGDARWAAPTYQALLHSTGRHLVAEAATVSHGASDRYLGQMATLWGRFAEADDHFRAAHHMHERLGAPGWLAHGQLDHARLLLKRRGPGDVARAADLVRRSRNAYRALGMIEHDKRAGVLLEDASGGVAVAVETATFHLEGEYWEIDYGISRARVRDSKGVRYLARLLYNPGREVHALDLLAGGGGAGALSSRSRASGLDVAVGDAGTVLDATAKAAYRRRITDLHEEIEEATALWDLGRADRAQQELDFLMTELSAAVGLGGRDRRAASDAERARQSVTRAIKGAVQRIVEVHPELGEHLGTTVRTGLYSSYLPDPRAPVRWRE